MKRVKLTLNKNYPCAYIAIARPKLSSFLRECWGGARFPWQNSPRGPFFELVEDLVNCIYMHVVGPDVKVRHFPGQGVIFSAFSAYFFVNHILTPPTPSPHRTPPPPQKKVQHWSAYVTSLLNY